MSQDALFCANHPSRETQLRCNRCGKPICVSCAVQTPVGYRCRECVRGHQKVFETARNVDLPIALLISVVGVGIATAVLSYLSFWGLFVAPVIGGGIAEVVRWAVRRRRSRNLALAAAGGGVLGVLIYLLYTFWPYLNWFLLSPGGFDAGILAGTATSLIWPLVNGALMISALYYRLRGIRL
jgi:hypothetical protein